MAAEWEKEVLPGDMQPGDIYLSRGDRALRTLIPIRAYKPYSPLASLIDLGQQEITIYPPPLFLMSPRTRIYLAADITKVNRYLNKFDIQDAKDSPTGVEATVIITVTEEKP